MAQKCHLIWWHHCFSHLLQPFVGQKLIYGFEIWHADYSYVDPIHTIRFFWKFWILEQFSLKKSCSLTFWGSKSKKLKIQDSHIVENSISFVDTFCLRSATVLNTYSLICDRYSWPFLTRNRITWRHFLKKNPTEFDKILRQGVKLMSDKVLKVWCRYLTWLSSYREYSRGGQIVPPPPPQRGAGWLICIASRGSYILYPTVVHIFCVVTLRYVQHLWFT